MFKNSICLYLFCNLIQLDPVINLKLDNIKDEYNPGEVITCVAEGNPPPNITWLDEYNSTASNSEALLIDSSMEGTHTYICLAVNDVRGTIYTMKENITIVTSEIFSLF